MDPFTRILIQVAQWYRNPPSRRYVYILAVVVVASVAIASFERFIGWPDWLRTEPVPIRRM